jgi:4-diphosphocytidyl-2-C-methyl-D-erythritol kinase
VVTIKAPAKLNLTLEVLGRRSDGFHEIRSVLQTIDFCDTLHFSPGEEITIESNMPGWMAEASLVSKVPALLAEVSGRSRGAKIEIEKRIPLMSGLGGDSSDAVAVLRGLNELWELGLSGEKLLGLAARLGSDVSFFLCGGTALAVGRGEIVTPLPPLASRWMVLVVPEIPVKPGKTEKMYQSLTTSHYTDGKITDNLVDVIKKKGEFSPSMLFNTFENVAFGQYKGLMAYKEHLIKLGATYVHLAGSGPTLFTMLDNKAEADDLHNSCKGQGMETYLAATL